VISGGTAPYRTAFNSNLDADFGPAQTSFTDLAAGTYVIFVRDAQGCETNVIVEVAPGVNLNATVTPVYECTGTVPDNYLEILLADPSVSDAVMYALDSTDPAAMQLEPDFSSLSPGPHYLAISHTNGCVLTIDFEIEAFEPLTLALEQQNINEITAIAAGGTPEYSYIFNGEDNDNDNTWYITETGTYLVQVMDENGCVAEAEIFMEFIDIEIPNYFTPDGDGQNDFWMPDNTEGFPEILIKIYDRYGRVLTELTYGSQGWDGMYDGKELPSGDYWYTLKLNGERDKREFVGHFTLYR
jgi:gliding motility-associated-like protein